MLCEAEIKMAMIKLKFNRFLVYLFFEIALIFAVTFIFRMNADRKVAALQAGGLFITLPLCLFIKEWKLTKSLNKFFLFSLLQFWVVFAVPMILMRLIHWDLDFSQIQVWGVPAELFHRISNSSYILIMVATILGWQKNLKNP